jgi:hypothetical protein
MLAFSDKLSRALLRYFSARKFMPSTWLLLLLLLLLLPLPLPLINRLLFPYFIR